MSSCNGSAVGGRLLRDITDGEDRQEPNRPEEVVGDVCGKKDMECLRIVTQNINGIGQGRDNIKESALKKFIIDKDIDIFAAQQLNVCWSKVMHKNKIWDRFRGWKEACNLSVAFNCKEKSESYFQPGGISIISTNKIVHAVDKIGANM